MYLITPTNQTKMKHQNDQGQKKLWTSGFPIGAFINNVWFKGRGPWYFEIYDTQ